MNLQLALAVLIAVFSTTVASTSSFITPPPPGPAGNFQDNPTHKEGQQLEFQWTSDLKTLDLVLWQDYPTPGGNTGTAYFLNLLSTYKFSTWLSVLKIGN